MGFYENVLSLCKSRNIRITNLEITLGLSRGSLSKVKFGGSPSAARVQKIADFFGVSSSYLLADRPEHSFQIEDEYDISALSELVRSSLHSETQSDYSVRYNLIRLLASLSTDECSRLLSFCSTFFPDAYTATFEAEGLPNADCT